MFSDLVGQQDFSFFCLFVCLFCKTDRLFQRFAGHAGMDICLCALFSILFYFFFIWPWKLVALNVTGLWHHRQLHHPMRAKPHLPDAKVYASTHSFHLCVCVCVYRYIYKKRNIYESIFPILWWELLLRNKQKTVFFGGTLPCYTEGKCLMSWK